MMPNGDTKEAPVPSYWKRWKHNLFGLVISCACLGFIVWRIDIAEVRNVFFHFQWSYLVWGLLSLAAGYAVRIVRWSMMLRAAGAQVSALACVSPYLGSIALNNILPMRLGDVVRALVFPSAIGVRKALATGSLMMERLVDLMTLLACTAMGIALSSAVHFPPLLANTAISLTVLGGIALVLLFLFSGRLSRWCASLIFRPWWARNANRLRLITALRDLLGSIEAMSRIKVLISLFSLSLLVWAGEAGLFFAVLLGFGMQSGPGTSMVIMAIATLSTMVPSSPGYIGPFHLAAYAAISMLGGTPGQAASFAFMSHLGLWLPTTLAGAAAFFFNPRLFGGVIVRATGKR